jgi:inorganic triphosphatase YgiF
MPTETELKLHLEPEVVSQFKQHPLLQTATHTTAPQHLYNTYFDTVNHTLLQQGIGLRIRRMGEQRIQTIKSAGAGLGGLHQRQEWETLVSGDNPEYGQFPPEALPTWCHDENNLQQIVPLFVTDFTRTTWHLILEEGSEIEIALDQGEVKTPAACLPLCEVELELKNGSPTKLYQVALKLQKALPLRIENKSKAALGYALHQPQPPQFHKAGTLNLTPEMNAEQAFIAIIWHCIGHWQANEEIVLHSDTPEGIHQMRVALRRLRSCFNLYQSLISKESYTKLHHQLKWLTTALGTARDWDIFTQHLAEIQQHDADDSLSDLSKTIAELRRNAYVNVRHILGSSEYSRLLLTLGKWLTQRRWRKNMEMRALQSLEQPVDYFANQILPARYQKLCRQGKQLSRLTAEQRHSLRISVKKMAYATRFFSHLYPPATTLAFTKILSQLQDQLGTLNDARTVTNLFNQIHPTTASTRQLLKKHFKQHKDENLNQLAKIWQNFLEQPPFWNLTTE